MANTYSKIYVQVVFAVKRRQRLLHKPWRDELFKYICGIVNNKGEKVYAIGGVEDHVHILLSIKPQIALSDLVREVKANSSKWINERDFVKEVFRWQEGFGAFSYAESQLDRVIHYINHQEQHHAGMTYESEYLAFLNKFNIEYDERYVFDGLDDKQ